MANRLGGRNIWNQTTCCVVGHDILDKGLKKVTSKTNPPPAKGTGSALNYSALNFPRNHNCRGVYVFGFVVWCQWLWMINHRTDFEFQPGSLHLLRRIYSWEKYESISPCSVALSINQSTAESNDNLPREKSAKSFETGMIIQERGT